MLPFLTSLTFLYGAAIVLLAAYILWYYRGFSRSGARAKGFPVVFGLTALICLGFLWINFHPPLRLQSFSNTEHHFLRLNGFRVAGNLRLGTTDTAHLPGASYNEFDLHPREGQLRLNAPYSEEPLYLDTGNGFRLQSRSFPATGHRLSVVTGGRELSLALSQDHRVELNTGGQQFSANREIRQGITAWNLFRELPAFGNSELYGSADWRDILQSVYILRTEPSRQGAGDWVFFLAGKIMQETQTVAYDGQVLHPGDLGFAVSLPDKSLFAWGPGFLSNNKNQFRVDTDSTGQTILRPRFPVSYPLTEENANNWTPHEINKFLLADTRDLIRLAPVFREGFQFSFPGFDSLAGFEPVVLSYQENQAGTGLQLAVQPVSMPDRLVELAGGSFQLPARSGDFSWLFSVQDTSQWNFSSLQLTDQQWMAAIFGALLLFVLLILLTSIGLPAEKTSGVWQVLSCITLVLLTTRYFLYWRYKTFPPFDGMDLPSQQQLNSLGNFAVILATNLFLAVVLGFGGLRAAWFRLRQWIGGRNDRRQDSGLQAPVAIAAWLQGRNSNGRRNFRLTKTGFMISWLALLLVAAALAYLSHFDPGHCRHLAIGLMALYFVFCYLAYRHSPLVVAREESWWQIDSRRPVHLLLSNPARILLATSLLALFVFIDIGFAIVFLNFLLFNEAFLAMNYAIAGLSSGSRSNARLFAVAAFVLLAAFVLNLLYAPYVFQFLLDLPPTAYVAGYLVFAIILAYNLGRLFPAISLRKRKWIVAGISIAVFGIAFFFFPKEKVLNKAAVTRYRIDVLTMPVDQAIEKAYHEGKTFDPVIRAAQNQWFINTLIDEENNPRVNSPVFHLLPHAPQNKGAKYNAQATDLVASRYLLAEHGRWSVLLFVLLWLLPTLLLASFYKLYPDFSSRVNQTYPVATVGFSILNYFMVAALLVVLAATGRYIFFGQDLPFASILSKQSALFPALMIVITAMLFGSLAQEYYANRRKLIPGLVVFGLLFGLLFLSRPAFNRNREFNTGELSGKMESLARERLQPVFDYFDTAASSRRLPLARKDRLFTDSLRKLQAAGRLAEPGSFFEKETGNYLRGDFSRHLDDSRMLYLDTYTGSPQIAVNENYFRVEPPPHLQQIWKGNVTGDSSVYNLWLWYSATHRLEALRLNSWLGETAVMGDGKLLLRPRTGKADKQPTLFLVNSGTGVLELKHSAGMLRLAPGDSLPLPNPARWTVGGLAEGSRALLVVEPDAFMRNYYVNGARQYVYPLADRFIWARHFAETVSPAYVAGGRSNKDAVLSLDFDLMDSLTQQIRSLLGTDTAYRIGAEYGITVTDGNGRLVAMADGVKGLARPDPNSRAEFYNLTSGQNGPVSQAKLRKQIGNLNLLRLNPGPGSTFKPIVFSAIASQLRIDWEQFSSEGFTGKQKYFGGERVTEYDFEKNNGRIGNVVDYLKYSDNYYHANLLLLGSYPKQNLDQLLQSQFRTSRPDTGFSWPYFSYAGSTYWLDDFRHWPGYDHGKADFAGDSSFTTIGLGSNFGIATRPGGRNFSMFGRKYDSLLFAGGYRNSGFVLPESGIFDQAGLQVDHRIPYDLFTSCFRGHVKGSSQVLMAPVKMAEAFGRLASQNRNFQLTLDPYAGQPAFQGFAVDGKISYAGYLSVIREMVFAGMQETLQTGTAAALGNMLKDETTYHYYAKTGTTGDDERKTKSKLLALVISQKDLSDPASAFRNNKFYVVYFTLQNGPATQNEAFQKRMIRMIERSAVFQRYMNTGRH